MNEEYITSLCVSVIAKNGPRLQRIADVKDDLLIPYQPGTVTELNAFGQSIMITDLIFHPAPYMPKEGTVGFWSVTPPPSEGISQYRSYPNNTLRWIEYVKLDMPVNIYSLKKLLMEGIDNIDPSHDYLFEFSHINDSERACIYCKGTDFIISAGPAKKATLKNEINYLYVYIINTEDIAQFSTKYLPGFSLYYYKKLSLEKYEYVELTKGPEAIIKEIIQTSLKKYNPTLSRNERKTIRHFLSFTPNLSIEENIASACMCDTQTARTYLNEFIQKCESYFNCDDFDAKVMTRLVEGNTRIAEAFQDLVQKNWEQEHASDLKKASEELETVKKQILNENEKLEKLHNDCAVLMQKKSELEQRIADLQSQFSQQLQMAETVASQIREKIKAAENDAANFLAEYILFTPNGYMPSNDRVEPGIIIGREITDEPEIIDNISELHDCLIENLEIAGVEKERCSALASYLLSAYITRTPLIIAGYGADAVIDALSATIANKTAHRVIYSHDLCIDIIANVPKKEIIAVNDAFQGGGIFRLSTLQNAPYICFISPTSEELAIEPRGIYNYALPVFTEFFIQSAVEEDYIGCLCRVKSEKRRGVCTVPLPEYTLSPFALGQCKKLAETAAGLKGSITAYDLFLLQTVPIMLSLGFREPLMDLISSSSLSEKQKRHIITLIGEPND